MSDPVLPADLDASARSEAMRRARSSGPQETTPPQGSLWQRLLEYLQSGSQQAGQNVNRAVHDDLLPAPLQINEALATQRRKQAMIDAALRGSE